MARSPYTSLLIRLMEIHAHDEGGVCLTCAQPIPCDTMRAVWIYDLSEYGGDA